MKIVKWHGVIRTNIYVVFTLGQALFYVRCVY